MLDVAAFEEAGVDLPAEDWTWDEFEATATALHDALGRTTGRPVYDLLGGARRSRVPVLRMIGTGSTATDIAEAQRSKAAGFVAFKIKVGVAAPLEDADRTRKVCEVLGDDVLICADANQAWTPAQAVAYVRAVEHTALEFFEQPVAGHDLQGMAEVAAASAPQRELAKNARGR